jgi:predicted nucleotidyltransferase
VREALLTRLLDALREDGRLAGVVLVGSGAAGFHDEESDLDVVVAVADGHDATAVYQEWGSRLEQRLPVLYRARQGPFQLANRLHGLLLDAGGPLLELDLSFAPVAEVRALRPQWKVLFDRTGDVRARMAAPPPPPPPLAASLQLFDQACHGLLQGRKALRRGRVWYAALMLQEVQERTLRLACRVRFPEARGYEGAERFVDDLPADLLAALAATAVPVERAALTRALRRAATVLLAEARALYRQAGAAFPEAFATALLRHLDGPPATARRRARRAALGERSPAVRRRRPVRGAWRGTAGARREAHPV